MKYVFFVGPPRCGLNAIAELLATCPGVFTCDFPEFTKQCERLLLDSYAVSYLTTKKGVFALPTPWRKASVPDPEAFLALLQFEARQHGWNGTDHIAVAVRLVLPLFTSLEKAKNTSLVWVTVKRPCKDVEASCVATQWMPRAPVGQWGMYTAKTLAAMKIINATASCSFSVESNRVFGGCTAQLESVAACLCCRWSGKKIGGVSENHSA